MSVAVVRVTTRAQLEEAWRVRFEVFVHEQGVPQDVEVDEHDTEATTSHVLALDADGTALGTGRLLRDGPGEVHLGRLAVRRAARGRGIGAMLVTELSAIALAAHAAGQPPAVRVALSAQETAIGFYERLGFAVVDEQRYLDAGIWHRAMARTLPS
ncbi:GNAT family N-acetyltransferase [Georgenia sp. MJ173]|uniref:GNAT family N-acetyltransferase n=1 Tax=Georgenia sunbinii TaxID=3117728 RepID=UPI002F263B8E